MTARYSASITYLKADFKMHIFSLSGGLLSSNNSIISMNIFCCYINLYNWSYSGSCSLDLVNEHQHFLFSWISSYFFSKAPLQKIFVNYHSLVQTSPKNVQMHVTYSLPFILQAEITIFQVAWRFRLATLFFSQFFSQNY